LGKGYWTHVPDGDEGLGETMLWTLLIILIILWLLGFGSGVVGSLFHMLLVVALVVLVLQLISGRRAV
jgi:hypothetical protein